MNIAELSKLSYDELRNLHELIVHVMKRKQASIAREFRVGDKVFLDSRRGRRLQGVVSKINRTTILVDCGLQGQFKCSPSLLTKAIR